MILYWEQKLYFFGVKFKEDSILSLISNMIRISTSANFFCRLKDCCYLHFD
jgi:hypothetical protein